MCVEIRSGSTPAGGRWKIDGSVESHEDQCTFFFNPNLPLLLQVCNQGFAQGTFIIYLLPLSKNLLPNMARISTALEMTPCSTSLINPPPTPLSNSSSSASQKLNPGFYLKCVFWSRAVHLLCFVFTIPYQQLGLVCILLPMALKFTTRNTN